MNLSDLDQVLRETYTDRVRSIFGAPPLYNRAAYGYSSGTTFDNQLWAANGRHEHSVSTTPIWLVADVGAWGGWRLTPWPQIVVLPTLERTRLRALWLAAPIRLAWRRAGDALHVLRHGMPEDGW